MSNFADLGSDFLTSRWQVVRIGSHTSSLLILKTGASQGCVPVIDNDQTAYREEARRLPTGVRTTTPISKPAKLKRWSWTAGWTPPALVPLCWTPRSTKLSSGSFFWGGWGSLNTSILTNLYRCTIKSLLMCWYHSLIHELFCSQPQITAVSGGSGTVHYFLCKNALSTMTGLLLSYRDGYFVCYETTS